MEKLAHLPADKQKQITDGALLSFSTNGYKKASVSDIAAAAGISKAMVFHYFGTKKELYLDLMQFCSDIVVEAVQEKFDPDITDFFERIRMASAIKLAVLARHRAILSFLSSMFFEQDPEVEPEIKAFIASSEGLRNQMALEGMDVSKFKEGVDPQTVMKILVRYSEGIVSEQPNSAAIDPEAIVREFDEVMELLRNHFYKEEYLH
ncbi:TetR/AcrR family transcriptional regulator [Saccharibacillus sp. CPCC 101409]|uniref:TetR/AcrR family transcriptional regulator n=1 Tax=Saccharibacillus sp. CPCC 101409 TaxID=3058041 RepID=UPI0026716CF6|nr:TetR/AcrR family transcriptional regulator [Saccharibacillus sp. CPCC 101409]MDO3411135.1 TetR/AcrR family transcriptional regulator [Saccharibacillus sp. CPCC 101409]